MGIIEFDPARTGRKDLVLILPGARHGFDSFAYMTDWAFDPAQNDPEKIRKALVLLLEQWLRRLEGVCEGQTLFLPYDFEPTRVGCLRCTVSDDELVVDAGEALPGAAPLSPTSVEESFWREAPSFKPTSGSVTLKRGGFLTAIRDSIASFTRVALLALLLAGCSTSPPAKPATTIAVGPAAAEIEQLLFRIPTEDVEVFASDESRTYHTRMLAQKYDRAAVCGVTLKQAQAIWTEAKDAGAGWTKVGADLKKLEQLLCVADPVQIPEAEQVLRGLREALGRAQGRSREF